MQVRLNQQVTPEVKYLKIIKVIYLISIRGYGYTTEFSGVQSKKCFRIYIKDAPSGV
jgi:hypothetical protein